LLSEMGNENAAGPRRHFTAGKGESCLVRFQ
jgi:hypothetical protein